MQLSRLRRLSAFSKLSLFAVFLLAIVVFTTVSLSLNEQRITSKAWMTNQLATAYCDRDGAVITAVFTNIELNSTLAMNVNVKDVQTGLSADMGSVGPRQTKRIDIHTKKSRLDGGSMVFILSWTSGASGTDQRGAVYSSVNCAGIMTTPAILLPTIVVPTIVIPTIKIPTIIVPTITVPTIKVPTIAIPTITIPTIKVPTVVVPTIRVPTVIVPTIKVPTIAIPTIRVPTNGQQVGSGEDTYFNFDILLHGIGRGGDSQSPKSLGNLKPLHSRRSITIDVFDSKNKLVLTKIGEVEFSSSSGNFTGRVNMGDTFTDGVYVVKIKSGQYLRRSIPGIISVHAGKNNTLSQVVLVTGDINNDNIINILDYNLLMGCYSDLYPAKSCTNAQAADLNDDGKVNQYDYNLFLRELSNRAGE